MNNSGGSTGETQIEMQVQGLTRAREFNRGWPRMALSRMDVYSLGPIAMGFLG